MLNSNNLIDFRKIIIDLGFRVSVCFLSSIEFLKLFTFKFICDIKKYTVQFQGYKKLIFNEHFSLLKKIKPMINSKK